MHIQSLSCWVYHSHNTLVRRSRAQHHCDRFWRIYPSLWIIHSLAFIFYISYFLILFLFQLDFSLFFCFENDRQHGEMAEGWVTSKVSCQTLTWTSAGLLQFIANRVFFNWTRIIVLTFVFTRDSGNNREYTMCKEWDDLQERSRIRMNMTPWLIGMQRRCWDQDDSSFSVLTVDNKWQLAGPYTFRL